MLNNNSAQIFTQNNQTQQVRPVFINYAQMYHSQFGGQNIFQRNSASLQNRQNQYDQQNLQSQPRQRQLSLHEQEVYQSLQKISDVSKSQVKFTTVLDRTLEQSDGILKRACRWGDSVTKQENQNILKEIVRRYRRIKQKNLELLKGLMDVRKGLLLKMYPHKITIPEKERQIQQINEKIHMVSYNIKQKLQNYKNSKNSKSPKKMNSSSRQKVIKPQLPGYLPLHEFTAGTQKLCKQTMKLKQQLKLCIQMMNKEFTNYY